MGATVFGASQVLAADGDISTVAGTGTAGSSGDGGLATAAELDQPVDVVFHPSGDMLISELGMAGGGGAIRRVDFTTGVITTFAGDGTATTSGDGGPASAAGLSGAIFMLYDAAGNLLVGTPDTIRQIDPGGTITTIAGTPNSNGCPAGTETAPSAKLNVVEGLAFDDGGDLYFGLFNCHRVYKLTFATGKLSVVAGTGTAGFSGGGAAATAAEFNQPTGVVFDADGDLLVADLVNNRVRKIDMTSGVVSTIIGDGTAASTGDGGPATGAQTNGPSGLTFDGAGNLFINEFGGHAIRRVDEATNVITTIAGTGVAGHSGNGGPATAAKINMPGAGEFDAAGNLYVPMLGDHRVRKIDGAGGTADTTAPELSGVPADVTVEATGAAGAPSWSFPFPCTRRRLANGFISPTVR